MGITGNTQIIGVPDISAEFDSMIAAFFGPVIHILKLVLILEEMKPDAHRRSVDLFIAPLGEAATEHATLLASDLRKRGVRVEVA